MIIPKSADKDVQSAIREIWTVLTPLIARNKSLGGRRITNAGDSISPTDYVTRFELDKDLNGVGVQIRAISLDSPSVPSALTLAKGVRVGAFALRGSPITHAQEIFIASDQDYLGWVSDGAAWHYSFGVLRDTLANRPSTYTANDVGLEFVATDTFEVFYWSGSAWVEVVLPLLAQIGGTTDSFPALLRETTGIVARLAGNGGDTFIKVLDEAYDATVWDGKTEVPTKNALRDKLVAMISDTAYAASWDGVVDAAPSKNAVYDKVATLATAQAPGAHTIPLAKITAGGTDGSITFTAEGVIGSYVDPT